MTEKVKAVLVGVCLSKNDRAKKMASMDELELLAKTAGVEVVDKVVQNRNSIHSRYYTGTGFMEKTAGFVEAMDLDMMIFDNDLNPSQARNIEKDFGVNVIDRTEVILKIFNDHAKTKEAKLQVKLAELEYELPRLKKLWSHLDREKGQASGSGGTSRGMGEKQIEVDKRLVRLEIRKIRKLLEKVNVQKEIQRKKRKDVKKICLVGYTNAGKSTLFNKITDADVLVQNQLFATLETTSRSFNTGKGKDLVLSDTVGFISELPHHLVASFRATLKDVLDADYLLHVVDLSDKRFKFYIEEVNKTLEYIGADNVNRLIVFNKLDRLKDQKIISKVAERDYPKSLQISAKTGFHIEKLINFIDDEINFSKNVNFFFPHTEQKKINYAHNLGKILDKKYTEKGVILKVEMNKSDIGELKEFVMESDKQ